MRRPVLFMRKRSLLGSFIGRHSRVGTVMRPLSRSVGHARSIADNLIGTDLFTEIEVKDLTAPVSTVAFNNIDVTGSAILRIDGWFKVDSIFIALTPKLTINGDDAVSNKYRFLALSLKASIASTTLSAQPSYLFTGIDILAVDEIAHVVIEISANHSKEGGHLIKSEISLSGSRPLKLVTGSRDVIEKLNSIEMDFGNSTVSGFFKLSRMK